MTAICLADGKTWSITSGAPASSIGIGSYYNRITLFICVIMSCLFMYTLMSSISAFFFLSPSTIFHLSAPCHRIL